MDSEYLKALSTRLEQFPFLFIYGAGGVAKDLLLLLKPYVDRDRITVVVSKRKKGEEQLAGYPIKEIRQFIEKRDQAMIILAVMPRLAREMEDYARKLGFRNYMTAEEISKQLYEEIWQDEINKNKIVFSNWSGRGFGGNAKYIAVNLRERSSELDLVWVVKNKDTELPQGIRSVLYGTYEHYRELGTARIWIDNEHKNFFTRKRAGQYYIQTWHGGGPLKKIEFDGENLSGSYLDLCEMNSELEDIMVSPSKFNSGLYRRAFHYSGEIMECGYPRNDIFWQDNNCRGQINKRFSVDSGKLIVLYAPTFRDFQKRERDVLDLAQVAVAMEKRFGKKCQLFVRLHPSGKGVDKNAFGMEGCVDVTSYGDVQELLAAADVLITDYSSVMWDFSLTRRPVFLYHPDRDLYEKERGYYLSFEEMPYIEALDNEELCRKIESFDSEEYQEQISTFVQRYGSFDNGTAAKTIGDRIMSMIKE